MTRRRLAACLMLAALAGCGGHPAPAPAPAPTPTASTAGLVDAINAERSAARLTPLVESPEASALARSWAASMASAGVLTHGTFGDRIGHVFPGKAAGEDVARGQPDVAAVVRSWMGSPPHRANVLGPFTLVGVGEAASPRGATYWCVDFIRVARGGLTMPDTRTSPLPWRWANYDGTDGSGPARRELIAADGSVVLVAGYDLFAYDQDAIARWSEAAHRQARRLTPLVEPPE